jgi:ubiquinone/menaquinone biosynthesis C-methylase UbiE
MGDFKIRDSGSYDSFASDYDRYMRLLASPLADCIVELATVGPGDRVLDIGTGGGLAARAAALAAAPDGFVVGVDLSKGQIQAAKAGGQPESGAPLSFSVMDAENLEFPDLSFDAVVCLNAVAHFPDPDRVLSEIRRVLRPGGKLVVSFAHVRPIRTIPLIMHFIRQGLRMVLRPVRPQLKAPMDLVALASRHPLPKREDLHTHWSGGRAQKSKLLEIVRDARFDDVHAHWLGHEVAFASPTEFWDAQAAIVTVLRKRLELADPQTISQLREEFLALARKTLDRGGELLYPFGSYYVCGTRPEARSLND